MSDGLKILTLAKSLARYAGERQALIARNVAHADTPGYRAQDLTPFSQTYAARAAMDDAAAFRPKTTRPGQETGLTRAGAEARDSAMKGAASPNGNTVGLEDQMLRAADAKREQELALGVWRKSLDILRAAMSAPR